MNLVTLLVVIGGIFLELLLTRLSYRWDRELTEAYNRERSKHDRVWHPIVHAFLWWYAIPLMYLHGEAGYRDRRRRGRRTFWTDDRVRKVIGESQWHRRERLAREHQERADGVGMPRS